jgi:hypothetical protein
MGEKSPTALFAELSSPLGLAAGKKRGFCPLGYISMSTTLAQQDDEAEKRKRGVRRTAIVFGLIALFFYVGFIVLTLYRGSK